MTTPAMPSSWHAVMTDLGPLSVAAGIETVVVGTGRGAETDLQGGLLVVDARTGNALGQVTDYWLTTAAAASTNGRTLAVAQSPCRESGNAKPGDAPRIRVLIRSGDAPLNLSQDGTYVYTHPTGADALAFSPDGTRIAGVLNDFTDGITRSSAIGFAIDGSQPWSYALTHESGTFDNASGVAWHPGSQHVAVGSTNGVTIVDLTQYASAPLGNTLSCPQVGCVAFSPDGAVLAAGDRTGLVRLVDVVSMTQIWPLPTTPPSTPSAAAIGGVAISADQTHVASVDTDGQVRVYDIANGTLRHTVATGVSWPQGLLFSPTLRHIVAVAAFQTAVIDTRTWKVIHTVDAKACLVPPDGTSVIAAAPSTVQRLDLGVLRAQYGGLPAAPSSVAVSQAATIAVADTTGITVVDANSGTKLSSKTVTGTIRGLAFADGGESYVAAATTGAFLFAAAGTRQWAFPVPGGVQALAVLGPGGRTVAITTAKTVTLLATADGTAQPTAQPMTHPQPVTKLAASTDGSWIATGCSDRITRVFDAATGATAFGSAASIGPISALAFQPGTALVASAHLDGSVLLVDAASGVTSTPVTLKSPADLLAFSADGRLLAVTDDDNDVLIYDLATPTAPAVVTRIPFGGPITSLSFNPADVTLAVATADFAVAVHDPRTSDRLERFVHPKPVSIIAHSADGALLVTACDDQGVRIWNC